MKFNLAITSEAAEVRDPEDGLLRTYLTYFLIATFASGTRWAHDYGFRSPDVAEAFRCKVQAAELDAGHFGNSPHWYSMDPAYGSDEYVRQGIEEQRAFAERRTGE